MCTIQCPWHPELTHFNFQESSKVLEIPCETKHFMGATTVSVFVSVFKYLWRKLFHGVYSLKKENSSWNFQRCIKVHLHYHL